ncbi:GNAT family N-acetyltransferase [Marinobacter shengliensis]|nr:GNAT family N-acetyltransferase [Marinobacter shengliensis]
MSFTVRRLSEADFLDLEDNWVELLKHSDADPLFMSWAWQVSWWETWNRELELELLLLGVYDQCNELVGLAPLYLKSVRTPVGWRVRRLHVIGNAWKLGPTVRTEYVGLIVDRRYQQPIMSQLTDYLAGFAWDEMIVADASPRSMNLLEPALSESMGIARLVRSEAEGVLVPVESGYRRWLERLGKNTRLKAFNRRAVFESEVAGEYVPWDDPESFLQELNQFHRERWGKPCFDRHAVRFHLTFLSRLGVGQLARLSALKARGQVVSVLYDVQAGNRVYNLQAGFMERFHPKLSLGTLHLGYAIEAAFHDDTVIGYDLLAGSGKNTFYKSRFQGEQVVFTTVEYVRSPVLKLAYGARACLPQQLVSSVNRFFRL